MTTVRLLSHTKFPLETLWSVWQAGKSEDEVPNPASVTLTDEILNTVKSIIDTAMPMTENIDFVFLLEDVPITLREQMVRHRIGCKFGENFGVDVVPDRPDSTWWAQSMRIMDMGRFANEGRYHQPEWLDEHGDEQMPGATGTKRQFYEKQMRWAQAAYRRLLNMGMSFEDARNIIPLGATHRITWHINLKALQYILSRRGCWLLQLGLWKPVIKGMLYELEHRVHPYFRSLIDPPCFNQGKWSGCVFKEQNKNIITGEDPNLPCPLYLNKHIDEVKQITNQSNVAWRSTLAKNGVYEWRSHHELQEVRERLHDEMVRQVLEYYELWWRYPYTGERVELTIDGENQQ